MKQNKRYLAALPIGHWRTNLWNENENVKLNLKTTKIIKMWINYQVVILIGTSILPYLPGLSDTFIFDDRPAVSNNKVRKYRLLYLVRAGLSADFKVIIQL